MFRGMNRLLVVVTALAFLVACTADPPATRREPTAASQCDDAFRAWADAGFSGTVAISTGGEFECLAGYGKADQATGRPNTVDTVFAIGSVTKAFTAAAIFSLVDEGKLSLDDPVGTLLPELSGPVSGATVRQLLLHTSGLNGSHGNDYEPLTRDAAVAVIDGMEPAFAPGAGYLYSNAGYTLLALIVEQVAGYRERTTSSILRLPGGGVAGGFWNGEPAAPGPRAVGYLENGGTGESGDFPGPHWALDGNGGLAMTTRDLATWTHALFTGRVVSPESVEIIAAPGVDAGDGRSETPGWVAYDSSVYGTPFLATAGGGGGTGHNVVVAWLPDEERVVVIASNTAEVTAEELLQAVGPALLAGEPLPRPAESSGDADPAAIVGTYQLDTGGSFHVTADDDRPVISATGADAVAALFPPRDKAMAGELREHEDRVRTLHTGQTLEGRKERAALEGSLGTIAGVTVSGTLVHDGEPRTYVTITAADQEIVGWYTLNAEGGVEAAEVPAEPPSLRLVAAGDGYRPDDPTGTGPDVTLEFGDGGLTVTGPAGATTARPAG